MGVDRSILCSYFMVLIIFSYRPVSVKGQFLSASFYSKACPLAESIVQATMRATFLLQPSIAPAMLKLLYVDCFVQGCDASVLISGPNTEKIADVNLNLRGFEVIDEIKNQIESVCPGVVSCADILALAAREAVVLTKGPYWEVKLGRKDGKVSLAANVKSLPSQTDITEALMIFATHGLNTEDFVALIGAHTIGTAACTSIRDRIVSINGSFINLGINPILLPMLQQSCPKGGTGLSRVALDIGSELVFDTSIFKNILNGSAVLKTDQGLVNIPTIYRMLQQFVTTQRFKTVFQRAMVKLSEIEVKTGLNGEIRRNCSRVN
ncbi:unnamed protein product [Eruca vesicaria subsp. sativa]|uniref:Peroxidase n=1 Tax=Eruca vesicaria subsp. sativa TaxID=29727 RepID=A0ABC8K6L4_ERUVS|nr:unnamed protein product [Eruca vesicaria subsp. sativa]